MKKILPLLIILLLFINAKSQTIEYSIYSSSSETLKNYLYKSDNFVSGGRKDIPYFQGKYDDIYIKFHESIGTIVIISFGNQSEYLKFIRDIKKNAHFQYKYCSDYNSPITYNYIEKKNHIRFNLNEMSISITYTSKVNSFLDQNEGFTTAFVCTSNDSYAYHTNLKCEGLGNCNAQIAKTNFNEAKEYDYKICEICTTHQ